MFNSIRKKIEVSSFQQLLFFIWLICIPFGAKVVHISVGIATLYPSLILGILFFAVAIKGLFKYSNIEKIIALLLVIFLLVAVISSFLVKGKKEALFDLHSIILFNLYFHNFILAKYSLVKSQFINVFNKGFLFFVFFILIFGIIESLIGIHIGGEYTYRLSQGMATVNYAPLFIYDNPNDYLVYSIGVSLTALIFNKRLFDNKLLVFSILVLNLFFAHIALSRFAILLMMMLLFVFLWKTYISKFKLKYLAYFLIPFILIFLSNKIYLGPIIITQIESFMDDKNLNSIDDKKTTSKLQENEDSTLDSQIQEENRLDSYTVRKNLLFNGINLFKSYPIFGIGPGQFRYFLGKYETKYPIDKNCSPHNYFIEMISQYGLIGLLIFLIPFILFFMKLIKGKWNLMFSILIVVYYLQGLMPSAFLYLDINWILFTVIVLCYSEDFISFKSIKHVSFS